MFMGKRNSILCLFGFTLYLAACSGKADIDAKLQPSFNVAALETDVSALMDIYATPGAALLIIENGEIVYSKGFGLRNIEEKLRVTPDTMFRAGSATKQFAAGLVGQAVERGEIDFNGRPSTYLDGLEIIGEDASSPITMSHLLSHSSGLGNMDGTAVFFPIESRANLYARLKSLPVTTPAGESFAYSNMGIMLAGLAAAPDGFDARLERDILEPLDMTRSTMAFDVMLSDDNAAQGYAMASGVAVAVKYENMYLAGPAGGLNATAHDMGHWVLMLLNNGMYEGREVLSAGYIEAALSPQFEGSISENGILSGYGYGFFIEDYNGMKRVHHGGNTAGFSAMIDMIPEAKTGFVFLTNQQNSNITNDAHRVIYAHIFGTAVPDIQTFEVQLGDARVNDAHIPLIADDPPSVSFDALAGRYHHPGYGTVKIARFNDGLRAEFPKFSMPLNHEGGDVFRLNWTDDLHQNLPEFSVTFQYGDLGAVSGFILPLRFGDEVFNRVNN